MHLKNSFPFPHCPISISRNHHHRLPIIMNWTLKILFVSFLSPAPITSHSWSPSCPFSGISLFSLLPIPHPSWHCHYYGLQHPTRPGLCPTLRAPSPLPSPSLCLLSSVNTGLALSWPKCAAPSATALAVPSAPSSSAPYILFILPSFGSLP